MSEDDPDEDERGSAEADEATAADGQEPAEPAVTAAERRRRAVAARRARERRLERRSSGGAAEDGAGPAEEGESQPAQEATGRLTLDTTPWSVVTLGGRRLGMTPLVNVELPAGTHLLTLRNPELGVSTTYRVTIPADGRVTRRLVIE
ncbi:MAG TPA: hypothetical protein RMH99_24785 [Sandaracinaceae bacterium LLY-WYZ-13_1]|nr:hypothetical protein [Sandaracinaceae bacterium LLY-WYZ-13_1]